MKDLIKEIEELKQYETIIGKDDKNKVFITDSAYLVDDVIETLNKHNIITEPKSIKLSKVLDNTCELKDLTIKNINLRPQDNIKWLYTLWIAGSEIIDDLR